jgi:methylenetetrahydrofolate dehydrogenase (NADP+) / methenyltetrahydrofolate cyclohydrolase
MIARPLVTKIKLELRDKSHALIKHGVVPSLKVFLIGNHLPSITYTQNKKKFMDEIGAKCEILHLAEDVKAENLIALITKQAKDSSVHGLFVQLPVPKHLQDIDLKSLIPAEKDVDGFHPKNLINVMSNLNMSETLVACTPKGVMGLLEHYNISLSGKFVVIIGRSMIVGKPLFHLMTNADATVVLCHSKTNNLRDLTRKADIIVCALGKAKFLDESYLGETRPVIIDVGINYDANKKLVGDVDFESIKSKVSAITPVPGGIGPMTIASLAQNLIQAATHLKGIL